MSTELNLQDWTPDALAYQINLRSLAYREARNAFEAVDESAPAESPLAYVTANLATLKTLGANLLYLMPPYPVGLTDRKGIGSPYSTRDFRNVDPEYGTLKELATFVRSAHALGFKVIFDITPNHTSRDNVWTTSHPEYYVKAEDGGLFYDRDWSDTAKLDYTHTGLRQAMTDVYDHWLNFLGDDGVDGFRFDMAHFINDLSFWDEALPALRAKHADRELLFLAECYGTANNMALFERSMGAAYDDDFYKICQYVYARDADGESCIALADDAYHNDDFADKVNAFESGGIAGAVECALLNYTNAEISGPNAPPRRPLLLRYTDNHDEGRGVYRFGPGAVRAMNQLIFMAPETIPMLLTGQEFGAENRPPIHERIGLCDKGFRRVQDDRTDWCEGIEFEGNSFARGVDARQAWYAFYKELFNLRTQHEALRRGNFALLDAAESCASPDRSVVAFARQHDNTTLHCAINLGPDARTLNNAELFQGEILYGELNGNTLPAFSAIISLG